MEGPFFVFFNRGPAMATDIGIDVLTEDVQLAPDAERLALPLDVGQSFKAAAIASWSDESMEVILRWNDASGSKQTRLILPLP